MLEVRFHRAHQRLGFLSLARDLGDLLDRGLEKVGTGIEPRHMRARLAFDQHADGLVRQLQKLKHRRKRTDPV